MRVLWGYVELYGLPLAFYTDKASLFRNTEKRRRDEPGVDRDPVEMPPTQIGRALRELDITWIPAHSAQAKGRIERSFETSQDRLVKGMRVAGVKSLAEANQYLQNEFLPWWNETLVVEPATPEDAHRKLSKRYDLAASLSQVETRQVKPDYTIQIDRCRYQIERKSVCAGLRGAHVRVEKRLDGSIAVRFQDRYLPVTLCVEAPKKTTAAQSKQTSAVGRKAPKAAGNNGWMDGFWEKRGPKLPKAIKISNATS